MTKKLEVLMDNGGGLQIQTANFCHSYEGRSVEGVAEQCAIDIRNFVASGDTSDWEGDQPEYRRAAHSTDETMDRADLETLIRAGDILYRLKGAMSSALGAELIGFAASPQVIEAIAKRWG